MRVAYYLDKLAAIKVIEPYPSKYQWTCWAWSQKWYHTSKIICTNLFGSGIIHYCHIIFMQHAQLGLSDHGWFVLHLKFIHLMAILDTTGFILHSFYCIIIKPQNVYRFSIYETTIQEIEEAYHFMTIDNIILCLILLSIKHKPAKQCNRMKRSQEHALMGAGNLCEHTVWLAMCANNKKCQ